MNDITQTSFFDRNKLTIKIFFIGFLVMVLLIPMGLITFLISDREQKNQDAENEIMGTWGREQQVAGPIISVPYQVSEPRTTENQGLQYYHFLAEKLEITSVLTPKILNRGIYQVPVYEAELNLKGVFEKKQNPDIGPQTATFFWDRAIVSLGVSDLKAIRKTITMNWMGEELSFSPAEISQPFMEAQVQARARGLDQLPLDQPIPFDIKITLAGGKELLFIPLAKETSIDMVSTWDSPSFKGNWLPQSRTVDETGFTAHWSISHLGRSIPQQWQNNLYQYEFAANSFGVGLLMPMDIYQKSYRSVRYSILFFILTFTSFFLFEVKKGLHIHPLQYLMVGFALCIFYLLLLSLSEYLPFWLAYLIAATAVTSVISIYCAGILKSFRRALLMVMLCTAVYASLYILLQLVELALLVGSIGLFAILAAIMIFTRNIDLYALSTASNDDSKAL